MRYIDEVDSIILLKPHSCGTVVEQGTYGGMKGEEYLQKVLQVSRRGDGDPSSGQELAETKMDGVLGNRGHTQRDNHEEQDLIRQNGDITLYIYYLRSIGWSSGIIFIGTNVLATFGIIFPRKLYALSSS